ARPAGVGQLAGVGFPGLCPPPGNTGGEFTPVPICEVYPMSLVLSIDWLNFTVPVVHRELCEAYLKTYLGEFKQRDMGLHTYKQSASTEVGAMMAWSEHRNEAFFSLNGDSLRTFGAELHWQLLDTIYRSE